MVLLDLVCDTAMAPPTLLFTSLRLSLLHFASCFSMWTHTPSPTHRQKERVSGCRQQADIMNTDHHLLTPGKEFAVMLKPIWRPFPRRADLSHLFVCLDVHLSSFPGWQEATRLHIADKNHPIGCLNKLG